VSDLKICPVCQKNPVAKDRKFCSVRCSNIQQARTSAAKRSVNRNCEQLAVYLGVLEEIAVFEQKHIEKGFGYRDKGNAIAKLKEEFSELISAIESESGQRQEEELGDLLYMIVSVCRLYKLGVRNAAKSVTTKLKRRIEKMRSLSPLPIGELSDEEQTELLAQVKASEDPVLPPEPDDLSSFTLDDVNLLLDALGRYVPFVVSSSAVDCDKHWQVVKKVEKLKQNYEKTQDSPGCL